jgi:superfamily I DNA/RNA helicase
VPARGIGKGVMEAVEKLSPDAADDGALARDLPLLAAGLQPVLAANSLWARIVRGLDTGAFAGRAAAALTVFRDLILTLTDIARQDSVSIAIGKMLDRSGYLQDLREERSEDADARIENLAEPGSGSLPSPASSIACRCSRTWTKRRERGMPASG